MAAAAPGAAAPGAEAIAAALCQAYPDQPAPRTVSAVRRFWQGGPDPLDHISVLNAPGQLAAQVPPHWHFVSFGLSDLHGDGRVHPPCADADADSGFGFELTFRLRQEIGELIPPAWPAGLLQSLARYVFRAGASLCAGDHVPWPAALDGGSDSAIRHLLVAADPGLPALRSATGRVRFLQLVGVCEAELRWAQRWTGPGVLRLLAGQARAAGPLLVTDMRRGESLFELEPALLELAHEGLERDGSALSGVSCRLAWEELHEAGQAPAPPAGGCSELVPVRPLEGGLHLLLSREAAELLPVAVRGRLRHGRHFTLASAAGQSEACVTLVAGRVTGAFVAEEAPYAARGGWLQVLLPDDFLEQLDYELDCFRFPDEIQLPRVFQWRDRRLQLTVLPDDHPSLCM